MITGLALLDLSWDTVAGLVMDLANSEYYGENEPEMTAAFWNASAQRLSISLATAQQAIEFILKARIAAVSPFLLIAGNPRDWPRRCDREDVPFADFRTIDAQDLIRVHDAVVTERLGAEFVSKFEQLRKARNAVMHAIDNRVSPHAADVVRDILVVFRLLFPDGNWFAVRSEYLERSPLAELHSADFVDEQLVHEFERISALLGPDELAACLGFGERLEYICPACARASDTEELRPRSAHAEGPFAIRCILCNGTFGVVRAQCPACGGGLLAEGEGRCVSCGEDVA